MILKYKAVIFDMDGTLIDSMYTWRGVFREFIREQGLEMPEELVGVPEYPVGLTAQKLADQFAAMEKPMTYAEAVEAMYRLVGRHYAADTEARPGALELINRLRANGTKVAVATATPLRYANIAMKRLGFDGLFDLVVSEEEVGCGKSNKDYFKRVADMLKVDVVDCLIVEDAVYSIRQAKAAGFAVWAIEDYYAWRDKAEIRALSDRYLACYEDVLEEIR